MRTPAPLAVLLAALLAPTGCADTESFTEPDASPDSSADLTQEEDSYVIADFIAPDGFELGKAKVYAHTESALYEVDPDTLTISAIGDFVWPTDVDIPKMTDLALDKDGNMIGVSKTTVYSVDPETAACTRLATFSSTDYHFVGLSYVIDTTSLDNREYLMGLDKDGAVYEVDPQTGNATKRGGLGTGLQAGGDVVSVKGFGTMATVKPTDSTNDWLASIDPGNGMATLIGDTGFAKVWGLGYWKGQVYGFTANGEFILIDVKTGAGTLQTSNPEAWWGAGVTTVAPVIY